MCVMSLMMLASSRSSFFFLLGVGGGVIASCRRSLMVLTHLFLVIHWARFLLFRHNWNLLSICVSISDMNEGMSSGEFLKD